MNTFLFLLSGFLGAMIGSFLNVVIYRYGASSIHKGRSICLSCGEKIRIEDLVPIVSYIFLGGKCRSCKTKISPQYIGVEIAMTIFGFLIYQTIPQSLTIIQTIIHIVYYLVIVGLLTVIAVYDFKHKIIPDEFSFTFAGLAFLGLFFSANSIVFPSVWAILSGPLLAAPLAILWLISKGKWVGLGDAKLFLGVGWLLGVYGPSAFILSFWIGALVSIAIMRLPGSDMRLKSQIPFAPFIVAATLFILFTHMDIVGLQNFISIW